MKKKRVWTCIVLAGTLIAGCSSGSNNNAASNSGQSANRAPESSTVAMGDRAPVPQKQEGMYFQDYGTNPFVSAEEDALSTFAIDVDTGSYTIARNYIENGSLPPGEAVRLEEYVNYFDMAYEPPADGTFAIHADAGPSPFEDDHYELVRIGVKGKEVEPEERKRANLTFVIDVSGSMDRGNRIDLVKQSLELLVEELNGDDTIGIVVYGSTAHDVLAPTAVEERDRILKAIGGLTIEDSTNVEDGLLLGYRMANESFDPAAVNRIILCSDGVANVGETGPEGILEKIERYAEEQIYLSTFGFGMGNYNDVLMEQLADKGDGVYAYIDDMQEAKKVFGTELTGTLQTIAQEAKIQVAFDPEKVEEYRLLGYENRAVADEDFRNHRVDGGEVGAGHSVTALYAVRTKERASGEIGKVTIRYKEPESETFQEMTSAIRLSGELSIESRFLASVAKFAELLKDGGEEVNGNVLSEVRRLARDSAGSKEQEAFVQLLDQVMELR
ncbi:VWA domain-containing protein [Paenibacillus nanensis]|uniref:VWA domain-containing protein n=1 Tax=Paenibacillus nanensis TaxID=393251 RepID=UPI001F0C25F2|nr:VWA domain-containing protein [Paenibacillus nanensis]